MTASIATANITFFFVDFLVMCENTNYNTTTIEMLHLFELYFEQLFISYDNMIQSGHNLNHSSCICTSIPGRNVFTSR